jgi:hypothetical protein
VHRRLHAKIGSTSDNSDFGFGPSKGRTAIQLTDQSISMGDVQVQRFLQRIEQLRCEFYAVPDEASLGHALALSFDEHATDYHVPVRRPQSTASRRVTSSMPSPSHRLF